MKKEYEQEIAALETDHYEVLGNIRVATYNDLKAEIIHLQRQYDIEICSAEFAAMVESIIQLLVDVIAEGFANHSPKREDILKAYSVVVQHAFNEELTNGEEK